MNAKKIFFIISIIVITLLILFLIIPHFKNDVKILKDSQEFKDVNIKKMPIIKKMTIPPSAEKWQIKAISELKRFQNPDKKIEIIPLESFGHKINSRPIKKVIVKITHSDGKEDSFNALIDSKTGAIIETFNRVKRDDIPLNGEIKRGLTPTGAIRNKNQ